MKAYAVTIEATITKTIVVEAEDEEAAVMQAHDEFTCAPEDEERYEEQCIGVRAVKEAA